MVGRKCIYIILNIVAGVMLSSCDGTIHFYPDIDEEAGGRAKIRLDVDWSDYGKTEPSGMTVICHHTKTGERSQTIDNNTSFVTPSLSAGRHWATVFNLTEDEFNYIRFRGLEDVEKAEAYAPQISAPKWYTPADGNRSYLAGQPEWLAVDTIMTDPVAPLSDNGVKVVGTLHPKNVIYTLHLTVWTENIGNVIMSRGAISGFASGRKLASDSPNDNAETVTHLIEPDAWTRSRTASNPNDGFVKAEIRCFGLPANHSGTPDENILEFHAVLARGDKVLRYIVPVGHLIKESETSPPGRRGDNLDLYLTLRLDPPVPPGEGDWGWDVDVDDWEEGGDVIIPFAARKH